MLKCQGPFPSLQVPSFVNALVHPLSLPRAVLPFQPATTDTNIHRKRRFHQKAPPALTSVPASITQDLNSYNGNLKKKTHGHSDILTSGILYCNRLFEDCHSGLSACHLAMIVKLKILNTNNHRSRFDPLIFFNFSFKIIINIINTTKFPSIFAKFIKH